MDPIRWILAYTVFVIPGPLLQSDSVGDLLYPIRSATSYITGQLPDNINKEHGLDHGMDRSALHVGRETARHGRRPRQATRRLAVPGHQPL